MNFAPGFATSLFGSALCYFTCACKKLDILLYRGTQELPFIGKDDFYDFNYQETRMLPEERVVQPGDSLQVICNYKTKGVRAEMTVVS